MAQLVVHSEDNALVVHSQSYNETQTAMCRVAGLRKRNKTLKLNYFFAKLNWQCFNNKYKKN